MTSNLTRRSILGLIGAAPLATGLARTPAAAALTDVGPSRPGRIPAELRPGGAFDDEVAALADQGRFSGTLLLTHRGRTILSRSYGLANREREIPNGPDTIFCHGSLTKLFTAVAVVQLAQQRRLRFDDKLAAHVDGFRGAIADHVTVHHLLTHTSGLTDHRTPDFVTAAASWTSREQVMAGSLEFIRRHAATPRPFPPGARYEYSNAGYHLLGVIVERVTGQPYHDYIRQHVFGGAGMSDRTDFFTRPQWVEDPRIAHPYTQGPSGQWEDRVDDKLFIGTPSGESFSTCADMERFARVLTGGDRRSDGLLDPAYREIALGSKFPMPGGDSAVPPLQELFKCYGLDLLVLNGHRSLYHEGGSPGVSTSVEVFPDLDWVTVFFCNQGPYTVRPIAHRARQLITAG